MRKYPDEKPEDGQVVIAYYPNGDFNICRYTRVLTWKGRIYKFVNLFSKGFWSDDVFGWNRLPRQEETI